MVSSINDDSSFCVNESEMTITHRNSLSKSDLNIKVSRNHRMQTSDILNSRFLISIFHSCPQTVRNLEREGMAKKKTIVNYYSWSKRFVCYKSQHRKLL